MEIVEFKNEHEAEYATTFKNAYFPYTLGFKKFVEALGYDHMYLLVIHDAKIINAMCLSKVGGSAYTPFGFCGGAINSRYISELYSKAKELAQSRGCYELAIVSPPMMGVQPPTQFVQWRFAQITHLPSLVYPRTIRKILNKADRIGFRSDIVTDDKSLEEFHKLCEVNIKERKDSTTHGVEFMKAAIKHLGAKLWRVFKDDELLAGCLVIYSSDVVDYFMVGQVLDKTKRECALEWLVNQIINDAKIMNYRWMNWQGSCDSGTEFFKARFRAEKVWYPVFYHPLEKWRENELLGNVSHGLLDKALKAGVKLGEFWMGKMR